MPIRPPGNRIKREVGLVLKALLLTTFLSSSLPLFAQNCDVDFPGVVTRTFSGACGGTSTGNLELGINNNFSDGDVFIFDVPVVTINGNLHVDVEGNGKIIIPAGVTVDVKGKFDLHIKNGGCTSANPCTFNIEVNGNASFGGDFKNDAFTIVWSGTGTVTFDDKIRNSNDACMTCGPAGCPQFHADPAECRDDGNCPDSDFCEKIIACTSDVTPPIISGCPANRTVNVAASGCNSQPISWVPPTANDNCALSSFTSSHAPGAAFPKGTTTVTYTATDAAGNTATCSFNVNVVDNTAPVISGCPADITVNASASCQAVVNWTAPTFTDNCAGGTITTTKAPGSIFNKGTTTVTYTATDAAGNIAKCSFNVNVVDNTAPIISGCPADITVNANASCQAVVNWTAPTFTDNCGGGTITTTKAPGSIFNKGSTTVTYTATDAAGNTAVCSFDVNVVDNLAPIISGCPADVTVNASASCQAVVNWTAPTFTDNCGGGTITTTKAPGSIFNKGSTTVTYTATDAAGNIATCSFDVNVVDNTAPIISGCPANITVNANASCQAVVNWTAPTFTDNCTGGTITTTKAPGSIFNKGTNTVTYTATDAAGNIATCSFNVNVVDNTAPIISGCPADITVNASASCQAVVNWTAPTFTDNCTGGTITTTKAPGSIFNKGTTTVTYTATDAAGNIATCSFNVNVVDNTAPVISGCPADITVNASASCQAVVNWTAPTFTDNCTGGTITTTKAPGSIFNKGTTTVTYTATDAAGNTATCSFNVNVVDNTAPIISGCPADITVNASASCQAAVNWTASTFTDNCAGGTITTPKAPGSIFNKGTTTVTYTATDAAGNIATCSFDVNVVDNTAPVISGCPADITVNANASCQAVVNWTPPVAVDNCSVASLTSTHQPGDVFPLGITSVTYTALNSEGISSICTFNIQVKDDADPIIVGPTDIVSELENACTKKINFPLPTIKDCSTVTVTGSHQPGDEFPPGTTEVTFTATDINGNASTYSFNVTVEDKTSPVFQNCPADVVVDITAACSAVAHWEIPTATDACGNVVVSSSHHPGTSFPPGKTTVTYTAVDSYGNISTCEFDVIVESEMPTIINCPADILIEAGEDNTVQADWTAPTASAQCGEVTLTSSHQPGEIFSIGKTTITYEATDHTGKTSHCSFNVIVSLPKINIGIRKVITPDGDGINDTWVLDNIENFKDNKVVVFDRWGSVIYTATGYNNDNVVWQGRNRKGDLVPTGTYYYTISVSFSTEHSRRTGFIELIR